MPLNSCPCGSGKLLELCCGAIISGQMPASTAEELMRSRYTAYTQSNIDYIASSMRGKASENFDPTDAKTWAKSVKWVGLKVISTKKGSANDDIGWVEFEARYKVNGKMQKLYELSEFHKIDSTWFYVCGKDRHPEHLPQDCTQY